jgi:sensor domain CHASE-containing protein
MSDLVRKQFYITKTQDMLLKEKTKELEMTEAELVRQALNAQLEKIRFTRQPFPVWQEEREFIKELMNKGYIKGGRNWKRDDLHDR